MSRPASASILHQTRFAAAGRVGSIELLGGADTVPRLHRLVPGLQMRRELDCEGRLQQLHVTDVFIGRFVTLSMAENLDCRGQAADGQTLDRALAVKAFCRIDPYLAVS